MYKKFSHLKSIAIEYLFDGMKVTDDIFNYNGKLLLLAKDTIINETQIRQLRAFNEYNRNISVSAETHTELLNHGMDASNTLTQEYLDKKAGYTEVKENASEFLKIVKKSDTISMDDANVVSSEMCSRLATIDPSIIFQCVNAPNPIDEYLRRHSVNVGFINGLMGKWLDLPTMSIDLLILSGLVHDIGKTKIPHEILDAPRRLSISEFEAMKMHPIFSYNLLNSDNRFPANVKLAARHHHEKMNGTGYPDNLVADQISLFAKITAVSDIYDAMVSKRSYKDSNNPFKIIAQLANKQFSELDISLVKLFTEHMPAELVGKPALLSDGSIGIVRFIIPDDLEHPLVSVNDTIVKMNSELYCVRMIFDEDTLVLSN